MAAFSCRYEESQRSTAAFAESLLGRAAATIGTLGELVGDTAASNNRARGHGRPVRRCSCHPPSLPGVGKWDESFLLYSEETDYMLRAADHGWKLWYEPRAVVEHIGGESGTNAMLASLIATNRVALYRRRHGRAAGGAFFLAVLAGEGLAVRDIRSAASAGGILPALVRPSRQYPRASGLGESWCVHRFQRDRGDPSLTHSAERNSMPGTRSRRQILC